MTTLIESYQSFLSETGSEIAAAILAIGAADRPADAPAQARQKLLTVKQAARDFNLGERTIYRMVHDGLPVVRAGRAIRINPRDLEKHLADSETLLR